MDKKLNYSELLAIALPMMDYFAPRNQPSKNVDVRQLHRKTAKNAVHKVNPAGTKLVKKANRRKLTMRHGNGLVGDVFRKMAANEKRIILEQKRLHA